MRGGLARTREEGARPGPGRETPGKPPLRGTQNSVLQASHGFRTGLSSRPLRRGARAHAQRSARRRADGHAAHVPLPRRPRGPHGSCGRLAARPRWSDPRARRLRGHLPRGRVPVRARRAQHPRADPRRPVAALVAADRGRAAVRRAVLFAGPRGDPGRDSGRRIGLAGSRAHPAHADLGETRRRGRGQGVAGRRRPGRGGRQAAAGAFGRSGAAPLEHPGDRGGDAAIASGGMGLVAAGHGGRAASERLAATAESIRGETASACVPRTTRCSTTAACASRATPRES